MNYKLVDTKEFEELIKEVQDWQKTQPRLRDFSSATVTRALSEYIANTRNKTIYQEDDF